MVRGLIPIFEVGRRPHVPPECAPPPTGARIALLFGGHSLARSWHNDLHRDYAFIVAVNGAALVNHCHWAVAVDKPLVYALISGEDENGRPVLKPRRGLVTYETYSAKANQHHARLVEIPRIKGANVKSYTAPRALLWALKLAGENGTVEIFGMDYTQTAGDVAGVSGDRSADRWQKEANVFRLIWDARRITVVHGLISPERLAFIRGERQDWPA